MTINLRNRHPRNPEDSSSSIGSDVSVTDHHADLGQASMRDRAFANGNFLVSTIKHMLLWSLKTIKLVFRSAKNLTKFVIVLVVILSFTAPLIGSLFIRTVTPVCYLPILFRTDTCKWLIGVGEGKGGYDEPKFDELVDLQIQFDIILDRISLGAHLGTKIQNSEAAVRDLSTAVSVSQLQFKEQLDSSLDQLASSMKQIVPLLSKMVAAIEGTVDHTIIMDELAAEVLQAAKGENELGSLTFNVFLPSYTPSSTETRVLETFVYVATTLERDIELSRLVSKRLGSISTQLQMVNRVVYQEERYKNVGKADLLAELWSVLGGNRTKLAIFESNFALLASLPRVHKAAVDQVDHICVHLEALSNRMEILQSGVGKAIGSTASDDKSQKKAASLEANIQSLHRGITRLTDSRLKAKEKKNQVLQRITEEWEWSGFHHQTIIRLQLADYVCVANYHGVIEWRAESWVVSMTLNS
ncbi:3028_t:CDS:2 [Acaulospora colombiana]|uniref:3028_t:CDS:1 n=1 Tax=Acaulospora colombiana TaxID=27376 RepID=A0ACA9NVH1_9GLOM|nr:3028_t:CDS:2 [Acaulospora colombiana]